MNVLTANCHPCRSPTVSTELPNVLAAVHQRERTSLRADFSWTFVGNAVYAGGQFAALMLLAKLLPPELVGQYALGLALVYPVINLTNLQLRAVMTSSNHQCMHFGHYLSLRLLTTLLALVIIFAITQVLGYRRELTTVVLMVGVAYAIEAISDVYYARLQLYDRMAEISKSLIARALLSVLGLAFAIYISGSLLWGVAGIVLARVIVLFTYDICERTHGLGGQSKWFSRNEALTPRLDLTMERELLWVSLPLGIVVLLTALNSSVPSYFIKHALGERDLGIFAAIGFAVSVGNMAVVSLGQSAFTRLARSYAAGNLAAFGSLLGKLLAVGAMLGGVHGPVFGIRTDRGQLLQFSGRSECSSQPESYCGLLLAGRAAGSLGRDYCDAYRRDRAACSERHSLGYSHASAGPRRDCRG